MVRHLWAGLPVDVPACVCAGMSFPRHHAPERYRAPLRLPTTIIPPSVDRTENRSRSASTQPPRSACASRLLLARSSTAASSTARRSQSQLVCTNDRAGQRGFELFQLLLGAVECASTGDGTTEH